MPHRQKKINRFTKRIYPARILGLTLGFVAVAPALQLADRPPVFWGIFIAYCFLWPHFAFYYATHVSDSLKTGQRQLLADSMCGGIWVAAMNFNLLPSVVITTMLAMNNMASGGIQLFGQGLLALIGSFAIGVAIFGWNPHFESSLTVIVACIPMLIFYPLTIGVMIYHFAIRIHEQKQRLTELSRTDGLTGLYNRSYWAMRATAEFNRCERGQREAVLIILDIDHFKNINDNYGHCVGDEVICGVAELLQQQMRNTDIIGRYGGEEFVIVSPDTSFATAKKIAERLRIAAANTLFGEKTPVQCTISLGLAEYRDSMKSFEDWVNAADAALYDAKNAGRNRSCFHTPAKSLRVVASNPSPESSSSQTSSS